MNRSVRFYLFAGLCEVATLTTRAQTAPPTPTPATPAATTEAVLPATPLLAPDQVKEKYKAYLNKRYAGDKEALAAIHMFGRKQTGGALWLLGGASFLGFVASQTGTKHTSSGTVTTEVSPLGYVIFTALPAGIAIGKFSRFSNGELYKVLSGYDKTHTFPGYVTAKLGRSDYQ